MRPLNQSEFEALETLIGHVDWLAMSKSIQKSIFGPSDSDGLEDVYRAVWDLGKYVQEWRRNQNMTAGQRLHELRMERMASNHPTHKIINKG